MLEQVWTKLADFSDILLNALQINWFTVGALKLQDWTMAKWPMKDGFFSPRVEQRLPVCNNNLSHSVLVHQRSLYGF